MTAHGGSRSDAEREGFLARWSRRKRAGGGAEPSDPSPPDPAPPHLARPPGGEAPRRDGPPAAAGSQGSATGATTTGATMTGAATSGEPCGPVAPASPHPAFDPATLPPVESLTADSDICDFLRAEVPQALRRAALRRIWSLDPAIRDFVGPADYAWDFNAPDGVPGFAPTLDGTAARLLARAVGLEDGGQAAPDAGGAGPAATPRAEPPAVAATPDSPSADPVSSDAAPPALSPAPPTLPAAANPSATLRTTGPAAPPAEAGSPPPRLRRHGGARPA